mgnify:CR=1 FL=1
MYSTQPQGYLEAELGDWKANRMFRIGVVDGGLFTFSDFFYRPHHEDKPLIVISNPRSVLYQMELTEPFWRSAQSTHIRAVVFSKQPLTHVNACITSQPKNSHDCLESFELKHVKGPLWVAPWSAKKYQKGLYYITITASVFLCCTFALFHQLTTNTFSHRMITSQANSPVRSLSTKPSHHFR